VKKPIYIMKTAQYILKRAQYSPINPEKSPVYPEKSHIYPEKVGYVLMLRSVKKALCCCNLRCVCHILIIQHTMYHYTSPTNRKTPIYILERAL